MKASNAKDAARPPGKATTPTAPPPWAWTYDPREVMWRIAGAYLLLVVVGFIAFRHPATMVRGNALQVDRALFASINAVTLSGFQQAVALDEYRWPGQIAALLLTIAGTLLVLIAGGLAVARLAGTGCNVRGIILGACALELLAIVLGPVMWTRGRDLFQSTFLSVSAVGHSGLHVGGLPGTLDWRTHVVLLPLSILGGLGVAVLLTLAQRLRRRERLDGFVRLALALWAAGYVIGVIALALLNSDNGWTSAAADASVQSINSRSIGFGYPVGDSRVKQWILMLLMATGGISGAAAGGIKLTTLACVFTGLRRVLRGDAPGRVFAVALAWIGAYGLLVFAGTVGLLATEPGQPADRLLFLVVSAASNVGLSQNPVSTTGSGLFVLSAVMLLGRVLPLAALWWAVAVARDENEIPVG